MSEACLRRERVTTRPTAVPSQRRNWSIAAIRSTSTAAPTSARSLRRHASSQHADVMAEVLELMEYELQIRVYDGHPGPAVGVAPTVARNSSRVGRRWNH